MRETKVEMSSVNWPTKKQTINYTLLVIGVSVGVAIFLGAFDILFAYLLRTYILK
ncbi:MAG: preprotein translocase subunit SecE [Patescibacteria group bacterium]